MEIIQYFIRVRKPPNTYSLSWNPKKLVYTLALRTFLKASSVSHCLVTRLKEWMSLLHICKLENYPPKTYKMFPTTELLWKILPLEGFPTV